MTDTDTKIKQFQQMAEADPDNELGHFSLGKAYVGAGRHADAIVPLERTIALNARMSKAHQLLGEAHRCLGQSEQAVEVLTTGVKLADEQGDRQPRDAMAAMLRELGAPVPEFKKTAARGGGPGEGASKAGFQCTRCGVPKGQLEKPPFANEIGEKIAACICAACWREWILMGTKVINELGLALADPACQKAYEEHMIEFLQLEE